MPEVLDDNIYEKVRSTFEEKYGFLLFFRIVKWLHVGLAVLLFNLLWFYACLSNQFDLEIQPPDFAVEKPIYLSLIMGLVFFIYIIPSWVFIQIINFTFKIYQPIRYTFYVGLAGLFLTLIWWIFFREEIDWFFKWISD